MPQLSFRINAEWEKVQKLREEIAKLKQEIKGTDAMQSPHAFNTLNAKLVQTSQELGKVEGKIISASAKMETNFKQKIFAASQGVNEFTEKIIAQKGAVREAQDQVRKLAEAYREAKKAKSGDADGLFSQWKDAKSALDNQRSALFGLTQEQATARLSVKRLNDEYKAFRQEGGGTAQTMDLLSSKMKGIAATVMGGMGLKELASRIISVRAEFESMETSLKVLLGGNEQRLNNIMKQIKEYALASPLNTKDMVGAVQMMAGFGIEAEKSIDYLKAMGDISMGNTQKFNSMVLAFSQMSATGKLMGGDLNQLINAGFNPLEEISRKTGKSIGELKEEMSKGAITSKMVQDAFISVTSAGGKFYGMASEGAKTLNGQISMLQESFDNMFNELGSKGEGVVMGAVKVGTSLVENYEQVGKVLAGLVVTYGTYRTALVLSTQMTNGMTMAQVLHTTVTKALTVAEEALNKTILANPYVLAAVALGTLITAVVLAGDSMTAAERAQDNYNKKIEENSNLVKNEKEEIDKLIGTLEDETSSIESKNIAFSTLIAKYPTIFGKYKTEKELIDNITEARRLENAEIERKTNLLNQKTYNENKTRATELNRLKYLQENGDIKGRQTQGGYKKGKDQDEYLRLWNKYHDDIKKTQTWYGTENGAIDRLASVASEEYKLNISENRKSQIAKYNASIPNMSKAHAQKELQRLRNGLNTMNQNGKNYLKIGKNEPLSRAQIKERITLLENNIKTERKTMAQWRKDTENETEKNRKSAKNLASSTELFTKDQAEKKMKAANDALATSEKAEKNFSVQDKTADKKAKAAAAKAERERNQKIKDAKAQQKSEDDLNAKRLAKKQSEIELENQVEQSRIDALQEGNEKTLAAMRLAHKKELEQIDKQKENYLKKKQDEAEAEFKADPKNKDKTFDRSTVTLTEAEQKQYDEIRANTIQKQQREDREAEEERKKAEEERIKNQRAAWQTYYKEFGTYAEKRKALQEEMNDKLAEVDKKGVTDSQKKAEKATIAKQYANQFDELDNSVKNSTTLMGQLFADASKKSISEIEGIIDKTQLLLEYLEAVKDENGNATINGENVSRKDIIGMGVSENSLSNLENDPTRIESIRSAFDRMRGDLAAKSPFVLLKRQIKNAIDEMNKGGKNNIAVGILSIVSAIKNFLPEIKEFGNSLDTIFGSDELGDKISRATEAIDGLATAGAGVAQVMSGDVVGGTMAIINGISKVVNALDGMFGADYSHYNDMVARYNTLNSIWDELIDKKLKYIETSYGPEAQKVGDEAIALTKQSQDSNRILGRERLNSGASAGSHSIGVRQRQSISTEGWQGLMKASSLAGFDYSKVAEGRMMGLFDLTAEQLQKIKENAQTFWAQLDDDVRKYLDGIIDGEERINDILDKQKEQFTQISFDSLYDGFVDKLMDMNSAWDDFNDDMSKTFMNAVLSNQVGAMFRDKLQSWYDQFSTYMSDGNLTDAERKELSDSYQEYVKQATELRNNIAAAVGYTGTDSQNATANGISNISYDQADNLTGIMTSIQIAGEQRNAKLDTIAGHLSIMNVTTEDIRRLMAEQMASSPISSSATREIINNSYTPQIQVSFPKEELQDINRKVGALAAVVDEMRTHGAERLMEQREISENTGKMVKNGMEMKSYVSDIKKAAQDMAR